MASKKKEELLQPEVQTQAQPAVQSTYSAEGLNSRADVEKAIANASYRPSQQVTDAADALKQWQQNRPADYQSSYQDKINSLLGQLLERENFQYSYTRDPLYRQYEQLYTQNAHNASADAAAQASPPASNGSWPSRMMPTRNMSAVTPTKATPAPSWTAPSWKATRTLL